MFEINLLRTERSRFLGVNLPQFFLEALIALSVTPYLYFRKLSVTACTQVKYVTTNLVMVVIFAVHVFKTYPFCVTKMQSCSMYVWLKIFINIDFSSENYPLKLT